MDSQWPDPATANSNLVPQDTSPNMAMDNPNAPLAGSNWTDELLPVAQGEDTAQQMDRGHQTNQHVLMNEGDMASQHGAPPPTPPAYDPRALLNPRASAKRPASDSGRGRVDEPGQSILVERLHNVHQRTASPAKRFKPEGGYRQQQSNFPGSRGMNLSFQQGASHAHPQPNGPAMNFATQQTPPMTPGPQGAIDLTMSDDEDKDEVKVVKDNGNQIICIGRIKQCYVQAHAVPFPDPKKHQGGAHSQGKIKVQFRRNGMDRHTMKIMVVDPTGREFGHVDTKTAPALAPLMDSAKANGLNWLATTESRRKMPGEGPPGTPSQALIALVVQLYCPRKFALDLGKYLKSKNIHLQDPIVDNPKYAYWNPQTTNSFPAQDPTQADYGRRYPQTSSAAPNYVVRTVEEIRNDVLHMFDKVVSLKELPQRKQSPLIKTQLLKHQEQALYFMTDKESGSANTDSLWQVKTRLDGRKCYSHVITGEEVAHRPVTARGGILADEMGLGKTLSILSLVVDQDSKAAAHAFSLKAPPISYDNRRHQLVNSRATLLLCPLSTMVNWKNQMQDHFLPGQGPKWCYYHGTERKEFTVDSLADHDVVITTYHMVAADAHDPKRPLNKINWFRIVLDEAHQIRSGKSKQAVATYSLAADRRWAVTGTPVQNRLDDLFALFKFLRVRPFDETAGFVKYILGPFKAADPDVVPKLQLLVGSLTLRRLKEGNLLLPPRSDTVVRLPFSEEEQKLHERFENYSANQVNAVTAGEKLGGSAYARILKAILWLRLISAHGRALLGDEALKLTEGMTADTAVELGDEPDSQAPALTRKAAYDMLELLDQTDMDKCQYPTCRKSVCSVDADDLSEDLEEADSDQIGSMTPCFHVICPRDVKRLRSEWSQATTEDGLVTCQFCDARIRPVLFDLTMSDWEEFIKERDALKKDPKLAKRLGAYTGPSTKTKALLYELSEDRDASAANPDEPPIKSVIFSCWTAHLDLIQIALHDHNFVCTRLDGRMDRKSRDRALDIFNNDPNVPIILVSIGAGGLGLNLTVANKVYVMEPQFNPAAEAQAVDRVHRLGQKRPVTIMRFIMDHSFEEKMLELQQKKKRLADLTLAREKVSKEDMAKQKLEELRSLFR